MSQPLLPGCPCPYEKIKGEQGEDDDDDDDERWEFRGVGVADAGEEAERNQSNDQRG